MDSNTRGAGWERAALFCVLCVALFLRVRQIEDFFVGPDDGAYLHSAQVDVIEPGFDPVRWVKEDVAWVGWFAEHYGENTVTYPHSYLHQFVARYLFRFGFNSLQAIRLSSALTGVLTAFFAWWFVARLWPERRRVGLLAAAVVAVLPIHVFFSRTGWGMVGFGCFYLAYCTLLYRVLFVIPEGDRRAFLRAGFGLCATSLLAFGWQEAVAPYIVGSGAVVLLASWLRGPDGVGSPSIFSRRTWTYVWSAIPVGALTLALALFSPFAKQHWFEKPLPTGIDSWSQLKSVTAQNLVAVQRPDLQLTWIVLAFALVGFVLVWRERKTLAVYLGLSALGGTLILFCFFTDAWLMRAYMPLFTTLAIFAAFGLAALARRAGGLGPFLVALALAVVTWTTWTSLFGRVEDRFYVQHLYVMGGDVQKDYRNVDSQLLEHLRAHLAPGQSVGVFGDKSAIFRLQDIGIRAREDYLEGASETWPDWIVAARSLFQPSPHTVERGGAYRFVTRDTIDRWHLYERVAR
ncbi:MAG: hypothetical protein JNL28_12910 [Planctomycetes bacterium]|nr:hypothetical protein [Planctomycetota bacterium]